MSIRSSLSRRFALGGTLLLAFSGAWHAHAATLSVTNTNDSGLGSLRQAVLDANSAPSDDTIVFDSSVFSSARTITLAGSDMAVANNGTLTISGSGVGPVTLSGNNSSRLYNLDPGANLTLTSLSLNDGLANSGRFPNNGGAINMSQDSRLTINSCNFAHNNTSSGGSGGAISNAGGVVTINDSSFTDNAAYIRMVNESAGFGGSGGVISSITADGITGVSVTINGSTFKNNRATSAGVISNNNGSTLQINNSTFADNNSRFDAGAIGNGGVTLATNVTVNASTFVGNNAGQGGGAIINSNGSVTISNSTFAANWSGNGGGGAINYSAGSALPSNVTIESSTFSTNAGAFGGGIFISGSGATLSLNNSIVAGNSATGSLHKNPDIDGAVTEGDYNLVYSTQGTTLPGNHNIVGQNALLGPLGNNGGPTLTFALLEGSPALDAGNSQLATDQRGVARPSDMAKMANAEGGNGSDIGAIEIDNPQSGLDLVVNATDDHNDGSCGVLDCTLREAINAANANSDASTISFDATVFASKQTIDLAVLPAITSDVKLVGPTTAGAGVTLHGGVELSGILTVLNGEVTISNLTFSGAQLNALTLYGGPVAVSGCTFVGNNIGIQNSTSAPVTIANCTFTNATNTAIYSGGSSLETPNTTVNSCTITGNQQGIFIQNGSLTLLNSLVVGNNSNVTNQGTFTADHSITSGTAQEVGLDRNGLQDNGGPTRTIALMPGSMAIDGGQTTLISDQRGVGRPQRSADDIGAFERINSVPVISGVEIIPSTPGTNDTLFLNTNATDVDGGKLTLSFKWLRNGVILPRATGSVLRLAEKGNGDKGDKITVIVTASDEFSSVSLASSPVTVGNTAPVVTSVSLTPSSPRTDAPLTATAKASDADNDALSYTFTWTRVRKGQSTVIKTSSKSQNSDTLDTRGSLVLAGDTITVSSVASDGTATSAPQTATVSIANSPVSIAKLTLTPTAPKTNSVLVVNAQLQDVDGGRSTNTYAWTRTRNGKTTEVFRETNNGSQSRLDLSKAGMGNKGDTIAVTLTANDGQSSATKSASVKVGNTVPTLANLKLSPTAPTRAGKVTATFSASDADVLDGVDVLKYLYTWKAGGKALSAEKGATVNLSKYKFLKVGDTVSLELRAADGSTLSATLKASVKIGADSTKEADSAGNA